MSRFYFFLWIKWAVRVSTCSIIIASILSLFITLYMYISQSTPNLNIDVINALWQIFYFWFPLTLSMALLLALFRSIKYIFNVPIQGYELKLNSCDGKQQIEVIGYGDLVKVWRRWFMLMIWLVGVQMVIAVVIGISEWFDIYFLFLFILLAGYLSFVLLAGRCKRVRIVKC